MYLSLRPKAVKSISSNPHATRSISTYDMHQPQYNSESALIILFPSYRNAKVHIRSGPATYSR